MNLSNLYWFGCNCIAENKGYKLLLCAKRIRRSNFVISLAADDFSQASNKYVGKAMQVLVDRNIDLPSPDFHPAPYKLHNLIFIHMTGQIFGAPSSLYTTVNLQYLMKLFLRHMH